MNLYLKQKVFSIGEKFNFYDEDQNLVYSAKGSIFSIPKQFKLMNGNNVDLIIKRKIFTFLPKYYFIDMPSNNKFASMKQNFAISKKFEIKTTNGNFRIEGSIWGYTFQIINELGEAVAYMNKRLVSWGDTYEIVIDEQKIWPKLVLAIMIAFDNAIHSNNNTN